MTTDYAYRLGTLEALTKQGVLASKIRATLGLSFEQEQLMQEVIDEEVERVEVLAQEFEARRAEHDLG